VSTTTNSSKTIVIIGFANLFQEFSAFGVGFASFSSSEVDMEDGFILVDLFSRD